ncbi:MAG: DUF502 domain-containing protein [Gammaproteobacteria bacterium]
MTNTTSKPVRSRIRRYLITGVVIWLPIVATLFVLGIFVGYLDKLVLLLPEKWQPVHLIGFAIPGLGVIMALVILFITGFIASNFLGRQLLQLGEDILEHIPLVRSIYSTAKQISDTMFSKKGKSFRKVVLIRYPQKDTWSLAFVTNDSLGEVNVKAPRQLISVFIPTTPNPTSGFLIMVPPEDTVELDMTVDEALRMIISLGVIIPPYPRLGSGKTVPGLAARKP